jgi:hypothetical protein
MDSDSLNLPELSKTMTPDEMIAMSKAMEHEAKLIRAYACAESIQEKMLVQQFAGGFARSF